MVNATVRTGRATDQEPSLCTFGKSKHVEGAHERSLDSLDWVELVVGR